MNAYSHSITCLWLAGRHTRVDNGMRSDWDRNSDSLRQGKCPTKVELRLWGKAGSCSRDVDGRDNAEEPKAGCAQETDGRAEPKVKCARGQSNGTVKSGQVGRRA